MSKEKTAQNIFNFKEKGIKQIFNKVGSKKYRNNKKIKGFFIFRKNIINLYDIIIIFILSQIILITCKQRKLQYNISSIHLKINGTGNINIISNSFTNIPNKVFKNGVETFIQTNPKTINCEPSDNNINNITLIWNTELISVANMFEGCSNIIEIDLSDFNSSKIIDMNRMFLNCNSLRSINFFNFDTSLVISMGDLFVNCYSLSSLDLSHFNTSKVEKMSSMFLNCQSITSLDLSNFDTGNVDYMFNMFSGCTKLNFLDLSNFNTSKNPTWEHMLSNCDSLVYINLKNAIIKKSEILAQFPNLNSHELTICSNMDNLVNHFKMDKTIICNNSIFNDEKEYRCRITHSTILYNKYSCQICGESYFSKYNNLNDNNSYINCYNAPESYFFDENDFLYKSCYITCKTCNISGNETYHNCLECADDHIGEFIESNYKNCYKSNIYLDIVSNSILTSHSSNIISNKYLSSIKSDTTENLFSTNIIDNSNNDISSSIIKTNIIENFNLSEIINDQINNFYSSYIINDILYNSYVSNTIDNSITNISFNLNNSHYIIKETVIDESISINNKNESIENFVGDILNEINIKDVDNGKDKKEVKGNLTFILTSTENQKNNEEINNITMNLMDCEIILKTNYNISTNNSLYILQFISEENEKKISLLDYKIYYPLHNVTNLTELDLSLCGDIKIEISISVKINDSLDKYNPKSEYYNNICSKATSKSGTYISLKDRRNEFVKNNMSLCEENCELINYDFEKEKVKCSCYIKLKKSEIYDIKFNKNNFKSFNEIKNFANLNILKCYKTVFKALVNNYGFYIIFFVFILYLITLFILVFIDYPKLKRDIDDIVFVLEFDEKKHDFNNPADFQENTNNNNQVTKRSIKNKTKNKKESNINNKEIKKDLKNNKQIDFNYKEIKKEKYSGQNAHNIEEDSQRKEMSENVIIYKKIEKADNIIINEKLMETKEYVINALDYEDAILMDKRNFCDYYFSLIKYNHLFSFSFAPINDYNSRIIKIFLFFFSFTSVFTIDAFFFDEKTIHQIYEDKGKYNFFYQIPQILYSTIIARIICFMLKKLMSSQNNIIELKKDKEKKDLNIKYNKTVKRIKIKFISFFAISFILLVFYWYFIICFCGIYVNIQKHLIKNSIIGFAISLIYPFGLFLIPGIFRIPALRAGKVNRKYMYDFSCFIENYLLI
jgi:surface protein